MRRPRPDDAVSSRGPRPSGTPAGSGRRVVLGIDIGSSSAKAVLADEDGRIVARASTPQHVSRPEPGAAEQSASEWWDAVHFLVKATTTAGSADGELEWGTIAGVCVSGHCPTLLLADGAGEPIAPALLYADQRADAEVERAAALSGENLAGDEWLPKLLWLAAERPDLLRRARTLFNPHDHVAFRLTGARGIDHRSARRAGGLLDAGRLAWRPDVCAAAGLDMAVLPPLRRAGEILGAVTADAATETGLPAGTPVVVGLYDTPAELVGAGVVRPGQALLYYGTTTSVDVCTHAFDAYLRDPAAIVDWAPYREVAYAVLGPVLPWVAAGLEPAGAVSTPPDLAPLDDAASRITPTSADPYVVPNFLAHARPGQPVRLPAIVGLDAGHSRADLHRAVLESYGFAARAGLESAGYDASRMQLIATGGGARSAFWRQLVTDILGVEQRWRPAVDAASGSAALAAWATCGADVFAPGGWSRDEAAVLTAPDPGRQQIEDERYRTWLRLRDAVAGALAPGQ